MGYFSEGLTEQTTAAVEKVVQQKKSDTVLSSMVYLIRDSSLITNFSNKLFVKVTL